MLFFRSNILIYLINSNNNDNTYISISDIIDNYINKAQEITSLSFNLHFLPQVITIYPSGRSSTKPKKKSGRPDYKFTVLRVLFFARLNFKMSVFHNESIKQV